MKKILATLLVVMAAIQGWAYSFSAITTSGQTLYYNITSAMMPGMPQTVAVTYPGTSSSDPYSGYTRPLGNLTIPSTVVYNGTTYTVTEIGDYAFYACTGLTGSLNIPNTVTQIKQYAFNGCTGLTGGLTLPNCITAIGVYAFQNCHFTGALTLPSTMTAVNDWTFAGCTGFTSINFSGNISRIGNHAFDNCDGLAGALTIPDAVTSIGWRAFYDCDHITSVNTGNGVQTIYYGAFCHCDALTSLVIGDNVRRIYDFVFYGCGNLTTVVLGESVDSIDYSVFEDCTSLAAITMRNETPTAIVTSSTNYRPDSLLRMTLDKGAPYIGTFCSKGVSTDYYNTYYQLSKDYHKYNHSAIDCQHLGSITADYSSHTTQYNSHGSLVHYYSSTYNGASYVTPDGENAYLTTFQNIPISQVYLHVPCNAVLAYQASPYWGNGFNLQGFMTYAIQVQSADNTMGTAALTQWPTCANPNANMAATPNSDYHFMQWSDGNKSNPRTIGVNQDTSLTAIFASNWVTIDVVSNNDSYGSVTGGGLYYYQTVTTLQATPSSHYHFVSWSDGNTQNPRTITVEDNLSLTAIFAIDQHTVVANVNNTARGTVTGGGTYDYGTSVFLTATPNTGYFFTQWNDGSTNNPRNVTVTNDTSFTAQFGIYSYNIVVAANDPAKGTVTGSGTYEFGTQIVLSAIPNTSYRFVQWGDGSTETPRTVTVTGNAAYTAIFALLQHTITVLNSTPSMGQVNGSGIYNLGDTAMLSAVPNTGYHFVQWNDGVTVSPRGVQVISDAIYTAFFAPNSYTVSVNSSNAEHGSVSGGGTYDYNTAVTLSATANYGYHFVQWSDGNTTNPRAHIVANDVSFSAQFAPNNYTLSVSSIDTTKGTVTGGGIYEYNTSAFVSSTPLYGYHFTKWNDGVLQSDRIVLVTHDASYQAFFSANSYNVTVVTADSTQGSVMGGGAFDYNTTATFSATAGYGYHFEQWTDNNTTNPRTIIVKSDTSFTAQFVPNNYTLTVSSIDTTKGTVTGDGNYTYKTFAILTATPLNGYHFAQWSDGNTSNPRNVAVIGDATYTAFFVPNSYTITANSSNTEQGSVSGGGVLDYNTAALLTATANYGYHFVQWSDGNTNNPRTITVTNNENFIAQFAPNSYVLTVSSIDTTKGTVTGGGSYEYNTSAALTATPLYGYHFTQWNDGNLQNNRTVLVTQDASYQASFTANTYNVTVSAMDSIKGVVTGGGIFDYNTSVTLSATANYGYHFVQWSDGNANNPHTIIVTNDASYTAQFAPNNYTITVSSADTTKGTVAGSGSYEYNSTAILIAIALNGYHFTQWSDGNSNNPRNVTVLENTTYSARFAPNIYTITINSSSSEHGTVSGGGTFDYNTTATLSATANYGYHFVQWSDGNTANPRTIIVSNDANYTAQFAPNSYILTVNSIDTAKGIVTGGGSYEYNTSAFLTATALNGYHFTQWSDGNIQSSRTVLVTHDASYQAFFVPNSYTITVNSSNAEYGTVSGGGTFDYNTAATLFVTANYGYHFLQWSDGNTTNPRAIIVTNDANYTAQFAPNSYTLSVSSIDTTKGTVTGGGSYEYNTSAVLTATALNGYHFTQWSDGNTDNPRNVTVLENATYSAQFAPNSYTISVNSSNAMHGTVSGGGSFDYNTTATLSATANYGYHFVQWSDGNTTNPRTITVINDASYTAQFVPNSYTLSVSSIDTTKGTVTGGGSYEYNTSAVLTATALNGYHFAQWSDGNTNNPRNVTVLENATYSAQFAPNSYTITVNSSNTEHGTVSGGGSFDYNTTATLSATANYGYHFVQWTDGNTTNPRTIIVINDANFTAQFAPNSYTLSVISIDTTKGTVAGGGNYEYNTSAILTATALNGYHFTQWNDGNLQSNRTVLVTQDASYQALFTANTYNVTVMTSDSTQGTAIGGGVYEHGSQVILQAVPALHHHFVQWNDGSTSNPRVVTVFQDMTFTAQFEADEQYTLTVVSDDLERGSVTGGGTFYSGEQTMITANAFEHYIFDHWSDGSTSNPKTVTIIDNVTYTAYFVGTQHTVSVFSNDDNLGTVAGNGSYEYGSSAMVTATPTAGNHFVRWSNGSEDNPYIFTVYGDVNLIANFAEGVGIQDVDKEDWYLFARDGSIVLHNTPVGEQVRVYDLLGKLLYAGQSIDESEIVVPVQTSGVYLVRVGKQSVKKVVVTK